MAAGDIVIRGWNGVAGGYYKELAHDPSVYFTGADLTEGVRIVKRRFRCLAKYIETAVAAIGTRGNNLTVPCISETGASSTVTYPGVWAATEMQCAEAERGFVTLTMTCRISYMPVFYYNLPTNLTITAGTTTNLGKVYIKYNGTTIQEYNAGDGVSAVLTCKHNIDGIHGVISDYRTHGMRKTMQWATQPINISIYCNAVEVESYRIDNYKLKSGNPYLEQVRGPLDAQLSVDEKSALAEQLGVPESDIIERSTNTLYKDEVYGERWVAVPKEVQSAPQPPMPERRVGGPTPILSGGGGEPVIIDPIMGGDDESLPTVRAGSSQQSKMQWETTRQYVTVCKKTYTYFQKKTWTYYDMDYELSMYQQLGGLNWNKTGTKLQFRFSHWVLKEWDVGALEPS